MSWTWADADPYYWHFQQFGDGGVGWINVDQEPGVSRVGAAVDVGYPCRMFGTDSLGNPVTDVSNTVNVV